ncbi:prolyl oligopeptidase family serine peptidase [[Flexibacter] sp. ATCC 35103]|uniref:S9 family peptidase n=1 Tax=[Flexibacter] sp. ATCC 35103 TaxID=1937528 RepID=UPI0009C6584F|nr:prolyl oligopeptidase family serine peptidase [[Flexibacter] sp. ATCC 35103]OMQ11507.1 hypothetical protein BXU01_08140 [[Flexibacter] sp. ATCC 35103]
MSKKNISSTALGGNFKSKYQFLFLVLFLLFILPLVACPLWGQVRQKKDLTEADYHLWGNTRMDKFSPDGRWASYINIPESGGDTLFVRSTFNGKKYYIPSGRNSIFTRDNFFYCQNGKDLECINLKNGKKQTISGAADYQYSNKQNLLIYLNRASPNNKTLQIQSPSGKFLKSIDNAVQYSLSPNEELLLCCVLTNGKYGLLLIDLKKINFEKWVISSNSNQPTRFVWSKDSKAAAFFSISKNNTIEPLFYYRADLDKLFEFNPALQSGFPENSAIARLSDKIIISDDLQRVFFRIRKNTINSPPASSPEIWNTNDKLVYPLKNSEGMRQEPEKVVMWRPVTGGFSQITTQDLPRITLSGNQQYALLSNLLEYEPQFNYEGPSDYYLLNLSKMHKRKIFSKASFSLNYIIPSPDGRYIVYFKNNDWWTYDIEQDKHTNITDKINTSFTGKLRVLVGSSAFGNPGWSADNKEILLYDQYDIWAVKPDGSAARRLTRGREDQIRYRIGDTPDDNRLYFVYDGLTAFKYDLEKELILNAKSDEGKSGYFIWNKNRIEKKIVFEDSYVDQLHYTADKKKIIYRRQKFDLPPQFIFKEGNGKENVFLQSNPQHQNYHWGKSELIHFENSKHQKLKGVLYYPAVYDSQKKYPMIVNIYEVQSETLHDYIFPSIYNETGFNPAVFTLQGYFVFLPDILNEDENVGPSSLDCVSAGIEKVISMGIIDRDKVGLMGHSFGGYETAFIINHTKLFKTAIASGAITDLTSYFLTIGWGTGRPDMWRFYNEQFRMKGKTPLENPEDFSRNSPLASITNLNIPLLLWSGKVDLQVDWHQSVEYYLAMRRLGKKGIMLLYPQEGHGLTKPKNMEDLTRRVLEWFGYFLKDEKNIEWINNGIK